MIPTDYELNLSLIKGKELTTTWLGGKELANSKDFNELCITRKMYEEYGHSICKNKFDIYL